MWKYFVEPDRPQITIWNTRVSCPIPKATNTHYEYAILIVLLLQQWLHERASMSRYTYIACLFVYHHHHHFPPWIRSCDLFRHRRVAMVSWGVRDPFFPGVRRWGRISGVWCCPFFRGGWSSLNQFCLSICLHFRKKKLSFARFF